MSHLRSQTEIAATKSAARVLEFFAATAQISFDRPLAIRTVTEMVRAIPGGDFRVWAQRLVEAGESLNLRIRSTDMTLKDVVRLVSERVPVAACFTNSDESKNSSVQWIALEAHRRGKIKVFRLEDNSTQWMSVRKLKRLLREYRDTSELRWLTGQPALPCDITSLGKLRPTRPDPN